LIEKHLTVAKTVLHCIHMGGSYKKNVWLLRSANAVAAEAE